MIYLDYNATTPLDQRVLDAMAPYWRTHFGNPASRDHAYGWSADDAVERARRHVADLIGARPSEVYFTSGATESINLAIKGLVPLTSIVTVATEHEAVLAACRQMQRLQGVPVTTLPVRSSGAVDSAVVAAALQQRPTLLAVMLANNETGLLHPLHDITPLAHDAGVFVFSDVTQAVGKIPVDVHALDLDLAAFSAHKMYGPKGVGALFVRNGFPHLEPLLVGGGQERSLRAGTLNVPAIVGFGAACRLALAEMDQDHRRIGDLRARLESALVEALPEVRVHCINEPRLANTTNIAFPGLNARALLRALGDVAVSTRAACASAQSGPSHVLKAMGLTDDIAYSSIRFSLGRFTTETEIDQAVRRVVTAARRLRAL